MRLIFVRIGIAVAIAILALAPNGLVPRGHTQSAPLPTFGEPTVSGVQGNGYEQNVRLDNNGNIFTSVPASLSSTIAFMWRSLDNGQTFKWVPAAIQPTGKLPTCVGGGDTELALDAANNLYFNDLTLVNFSGSVSSPGAPIYPNSTTPTDPVAGRTFVGGNATPLVNAGQPPSCETTPATQAVDRQWYAVEGNPLTDQGSLFLAYDRVAQSNPAICPAGGPSTPIGGNVVVLTQSPISNSANTTGAVDPSAGNTFGPAQTVSCDEGIMGNDEFFNYPANSTGLHVGPRIFVIHDNAAFSSVSMGRCDVTGPPVPASTTPGDLLGILSTGGTGLSNCSDNLVSAFTSDGTPSGTQTGITGGNFPTMAIDSAGNLYAFWEQAPYSPTDTEVTGDTSIMYSVSRDEGTTWAPEQRLPTTGLLNNVYAWPAAGSNGRVDIAWYGTPASCNEACQEAGPGVGSTSTSTTTGGPDHVVGQWSTWFMQTTDAGASWTAPIQASEHFNHFGTLQTVIGGQEGDRTLGDFIQLRLDKNGGANISYADSNNITEADTPQATFVRQNGGTSAYATANGGAGTIPGSAIRPLNSVVTAPHTASFDSATFSTDDIKNLHINSSSISQPDSTHYQVTMKVEDLTSLSPPSTSTDPLQANAKTAGNDLVWLTQWHVPSTSDPNGGKLFFAYMESDAGGTPTCYDGENASEALGGGITLTYPGAKMVPCTYTATAPGTITITVPMADVAEANPLTPNVLYSANASTQILTAPANSVPSTGGIGGVPPSLVDVSPTYDVNFTNPTLARVARFTAHRSGARLTFRWTMAASGGAVAFNLYGGMHRLNRSPIAAHHSATYRYTVRTTVRGPYSLRVVLRDGHVIAVPLQ